MSRNTTLKRYTAIALMSIVPFLTGCSSAEERRNATIQIFKDLQQTASGTVTDVQGQVDSLLDTGKSVTDGVTDMVKDAQKRINQVQSGVNLLLKGKEMIESGVSGE